MNFLAEKTSEVSIPASVIKAPGILLKDKKDPFEVRINRASIKNLIEDFKNKVESPFHSFQHIPSGQTRRFKTDIEPKPTLRNMMSSNFITFVKCPGRLKSVSDKISSLFQKAKDILSIYGIELTIEDSKISQEIYNLLKILVPEISFFPSDFFKNLRVSKLILCKKAFCEACYHSKVSLSVNVLDSKDKVRQRLYKIIFDHLMITNSDVYKKWKEDKLENEQSDLHCDSLEQFEETFMGLMNNTNHALLRPMTKKLRELLANYYPEAMSEEQFKSRNKEKKKTFRVRFDTEPY